MALTAEIQTQPDPAPAHDPPSLRADSVESPTNPAPGFLLLKLIADLEAMAVDLGRSHMAQYAVLAKRAAAELRARV